MEHFNLAFVTGASSGIGEALCRLLAQKGISLIIAGRNREKLLALQKELKVDVEIVVADLSDRKERRLVVEKIHERAPDLFVNNAGFSYYGDALTFETEAQESILEVNGNAVLELTLEAVRTMVSKEKRGVVMNLSSSAAYQVFPSMAVYSAAKAFVNQFSESLDYETRGLGIRVLAICPGMVATNFSSTAAGRDLSDNVNSVTMSPEFVAEQIWKQIVREKPLKVVDWKYRLGTFFSKYILPKWLVVKVLRSSTDARAGHRPIIKN